MKSILIMVCSSLLMTALAQAMVNRDFNKLDSISQPAEVEALVASLDKRFAKFRVNTALTFEDDYCLKLPKAASAIVKTDLDNNGSTDMLVFGMLERKPVIIAIIDAGNNTHALKNITRSFSRRCSTAEVIREDQKTLVEYFYFKQPVWTYDSAHAVGATRLIHKIESSKLIYKFDDFVEYNKSPQNHQIEKIKYKQGGFSIEIFSNETARYKTTGYDPLRGRGMFNAWFNSTLKESEWSELTGLLNYLDFTNLADKYYISGSHYATGILEIIYDDGKVKTINDDGLMGTFGLNRVYQMMNALKNNQAWNLEPTKALVPLPRTR